MFFNIEELFGFYYYRLPESWICPLLMGIFPLVPESHIHAKYCVNVNQKHLLGSWAYVVQIPMPTK